MDWRGIRKRKREHGEGPLTAQRGQGSVPKGYVSLTPPQNEIDLLSNNTSCQCLQGGTKLDECGTAGEKQLDYVSLMILVC